MIRAYAGALLGSAVISVLSNPDIRGWRAVAIAGLGSLLWAFSVVEAARTLFDKVCARPAELSGITM